MLIPKGRFFPSRDHLSTFNNQWTIPVAAQDVLIEIGIDPIYGPKMLPFAPNCGHYHQPNKDLYQKVIDTKHDGLLDGDSPEQIYESLTKLLKKEADDKKENGLATRNKGNLRRFNKI
ncbi:MAG: hypothetical protein AAF483_10850 [Planctomycetota bacterium]